MSALTTCMEATTMFRVGASARLQRLKFALALASCVNFAGYSAFGAQEGDAAQSTTPSTGSTQATLPEIVVEPPRPDGTAPQTQGNTAPQGPATQNFPTQPSGQPFPSQNFPNRSVGDLANSILNNNTFASGSSNGYASDSATTGTGIDIPFIQTPASVDVVSRATLNDQQVLRFNDVFRNVAGATPVGDGIFPDRLFLRGLEVVSRDFRKNGFLDPTYTPRDFANIERVEILKGPGSIMYGAASPAGIVNFITKKPLDADFADYNYTFGSYGLNRHQVDVNSRVTEDGKLLFRFNGAIEDSDSFRDFGYTDRYLLAPSLRWVIDEDTMLTWEAEIVDNDRRADTGTAAFNGNALALPPNRYLGSPQSDFIHTEDYRTSVVLNHNIDEDWSFQVGGYTVFYEFPGIQTFPVAQIGPTQLFRLQQTFTDQEQASSLIANLSGRTEILGVEHKTLFGTEQVYYDSASNFSGEQLFEIPSFDAFNPSYNNIVGTAPAYNTDFPVFRQVRHGYYLQDYITLNPHWQLLGGVRFDDVDLTFQRNLGLGDTRTEERFTRTTPRGGIIFQPIPDLLSTYYNYSQSFSPPGGGAFPFTNQQVRAELGEMHELGVKSWLLENLSLRTAGFYIERQNVPFADFGANGPIYTQVGQEQSQGAEVEMVGNLSSRSSVIANYTYTDTKLSDATNPDIFGQYQRNVPLNMANLWTRFDLLQRSNQTFGVAAGMVWVDKRSGNLSGTQELPSYVRWDGGVYYRQGRMYSSLYAENIFDKQYAQSSINEFQIYQGSPSALRAQVGARF